MYRSKAGWSRLLLSSPSYVLSFARTSWHAVDTQLDQLGIHRLFDNFLRSPPAAHIFQSVILGLPACTEIALQVLRIPYSVTYQSQFPIADTG